MKGYKGMNKDMTCRGMQFEVGKSYHVDGTIEVCKNGLHFCENLKDVFQYYSKDNSRFFEISAKHVLRDGDKCAASDIKIVRELTDIEINRCYYGYGNGDGNGDGDGDGNGNGDGYGNGYGNGNGDGNGYGYGENIQKIISYI